jgi:Phage gp6-like head-tail connector protein
MLDFTHDTLGVTGALLSLAEVKDHLRVTDALHDADITAKSDAAQAAVLAYLTTAVDPAWTPLSVPKPVKHAILLLTTHLYEHRGDDMNPSASGSTPDRDVWEAIARMLAMYRDPTLA